MRSSRIHWITSHGRWFMVAADAWLVVGQHANESFLHPAWDSVTKKKPGSIPNRHWSLCCFTFQLQHIFFLLFFCRFRLNFLCLRILIIRCFWQDIFTFLTTCFLFAPHPSLPPLPLCIAGYTCGRPRRRKPWRLRAWLSGQALPVAGQRSFPDGSGAPTRSGNKSRGGEGRKEKEKGKNMCTALKLNVKKKGTFSILLWLSLWLKSCHAHTKIHTPWRAKRSKTKGKIK